MNAEETGDTIDAGLAARAEAGDQRAFAELMVRHKAWLYRFVRRHQPDAEEAFDILQETFTSAWGALRRYDPERPFHVWLRRIAFPQSFPTSPMSSRSSAAASSLRAR